MNSCRDDNLDDDAVNDRSTAVETRKKTVE